MDFSTLLATNYNYISSAMLPYLYAVGAITGAAFTPLMLKFILAAPYTNCVEHASSPEESLSITTEQASGQQNWLMFSIFIIMAITSSIAAHIAPYWSQIITAILFTWVVIAEIFLEIRLQVVTNWLPIIAIWLGLIFITDPNNPNIAINSIINIIIAWGITHIVIKLAAKINILKNINTIFHPIFIAALGAWLKLTVIPIIIVAGFVMAAVMLFVETMTYNFISKIHPKIQLTPVSIKMPVNAWLLATTWIYIFIINS